MKPISAMRGKRRRASRLDRMYEERNLVRTGVAARLLHIDAELLADRIRDGIVDRKGFEVDGQRYNGIPLDEVIRMHDAMWGPRCECTPAAS